MAETTESKLPEELQNALKNIADTFEREDRFVRELNLRVYKRNHEYFDGFQRIFWNEAIGDWSSPEMLQAVGQDLTDGDSEDDKIVNIFKAHAESIIAALSIQLPTVVFFPSDADNPDDTLTSKAYTKLGSLIQRDNEALLLFIHALWLHWNEGLVASYSYLEADEEYGIVKKSHYTTKTIKSTKTVCPSCQSVMEDGEKCEICGFEGPAESIEVDEEIPQLQRVEDIPKSKVRVEVYGPLHVKVSHLARKQKNVGILTLSYETPLAEAQDIYEEIADKISVSNDSYAYDKWARLSPHYKGSEPSEVVTVRKVWYRPWAFRSAGTPEEVWKELKKKFPKGCCAVFVNEILAEAFEEDLDEHWTIINYPLSQNIHPQPQGNSMIPIQDARNDLFNLKLQSVEYGIPETFADQEVLNFTEFGKVPARPGMISPAKAPLGGKVADGFYTLKTSTYPDGITELSREIDADAQFVVGSFPSIFGGPQTSGSKTLGEYQQSRAQAMQRLSTVWKVFSAWWAKTMGKATAMYAQNLKELDTEVKDVIKENSSFVNVWVKAAELSGKVGRVEPEANEQFPVSWTQKRDLLMELLQFQIPELMAIISNPENSGLIAALLGFPELYIPGANDRNKQYQEIARLINGEEVPTEPLIDDAPVHIQTLKAFLGSEKGQTIKETNPDGYQMCMMHLQMHEQDEMQQTMQPNQTPAGVPPETAAPPQG